MKAIVVVAILLACAFAVQDEGLATIQKMENNSFGKRVLDTIALQIQSGDPADDLIHMLQDQEDKLQEEQSVADEWIMALQNQCVEDLARLVDEITATRQRIQELEDLIKELTPIRTAKIEERDNLLDYKALLEAKLQEIAVAKDAKDAEWAEEREAHDSQTAIIQRVKDIIVSGLSANFLQSNAQAQQTVLVQVAQHLNNAKKTHFKTKGMTSIFRVLAQVANSQEIQAAQSSIQRIVDLCQQLLDKIAESRAIEKRDYDLWIAEYERTKAGLTASLEETNAKIQKLNTEIAVLTKRINNATTELEEQTVRLEQKITQHDERESFCDGAGKQYAREREERSDQLDIISDAIGLLTAKIRLLKKYVSDSVSSLEKPIF